jgi:hypothetical protein
MKSSGREIEIIGAPLDLGQQRRGVDMGPSALRVAGLATKLEALGYTVTDRGNVAVPVAEIADRGDDRARFLNAIAKSDESVAGYVSEALKRLAIPLVVGGDHSVAAGTVAGVAQHFRAQKRGDRPDLDRRSLRHQYASDVRFRKRARHAAGRGVGNGSRGFEPSVGLVTESACAACGPGRYSRCGSRASARTLAARA